MTTTAIGELMHRLGGEFFQQAWIVEDMKAAQQAMRSSFGCNDFVEFRMNQTWNLRGQEAPCGLWVAFARSGDMQIELMQPTSGEGIHVEFLERRGSGMHHFGMLVDELAPAVDVATGLGFPPVMSSEFGNVRLSYIDTTDALGAYLELIEDPDGLFVKTMPWRDEQVLT